MRDHATIHHPNYPYKEDYYHCSRCERAIPESQLGGGNTIRVDGMLVCRECLVREEEMRGEVGEIMVDYHHAVRQW